MAQPNSNEPDKILISIVQRSLHKTLFELVQDHLAFEMSAYGIELTQLQKADAAAGLLNGTNGTLTFDLDDAQVEGFRARNHHVALDEIEMHFDALAGKMEAFVSNIPTVTSLAVINVADHIATRLIEDWTEQAPTIMAQVRLNHTEFVKVLQSRWGQALDSLEALIDLSADIGGQWFDDTRLTAEADSPMLAAMFALHVRACQVSREVEVLLRAGLADGALARWRTLHELAVTSSFITKHGPEIATRFMDHADIQSWRAARQYQRHCVQLGQVPIPEKQMADLDSRRTELVARYGDDFEHDYGWAASAIPVRPRPQSNRSHSQKPNGPTFSQIELIVGLDYIRPFYQTASDNVHAGSRGTAFRLGSALAGSSDVGLELPGRNTAWSLIRINCELLAQRPGLEGLSASKAIQRLGPPIYRAFDEAAY